MSRLIKLRPYNSRLVSLIKIMYSLKGIPEWYAKILQIVPQVYREAADTSNRPKEGKQ